MAAWKQGNQSRTCWRSLNDQQECEVWFSVQKLKYIKQALWSYMQHSTTWMLSDTVKHCKRFKDLKCAVFIIFVGFSGSLDGGGKKKSDHKLWAFSVNFSKITFTPGGSEHLHHQDYIQIEKHSISIHLHTHVSAALSTENCNVSDFFDHVSYCVAACVFNIWLLWLHLINEGFL